MHVAFGPEDLREALTLMVERKLGPLAAELVSDVKFIVWNGNLVHIMEAQVMMSDLRDPSLRINQIGKDGAE